eukprot:UN16718
MKANKITKFFPQPMVFSLSKFEGLSYLSKKAFVLAHFTRHKKYSKSPRQPHFLKRRFDNLK